MLQYLLSVEESILKGWTFKNFGGSKADRITAQEIQVSLKLLKVQTFLGAKNDEERE